MSGGGSSTVGSKRERRASGVRGVVWDEPNLAANEAIKAAMQPIKINEPKTPYHGPAIAEEDSDGGSADMIPLTLEEEDQGQASVSQENGEADRLEQLESRLSSDVDAGPPSPRRSSWDGSLHGSSPGSFYDSEDDEQKAEKRRKFEEHRKKHYQMSAEAKEALHRTQADELAKTGGLGDSGTAAGDQAGVQAGPSAAVS